MTIRECFKTLQGANLWKEVEPANAKVATKFLFFLFFSFSSVFLDGVTKVICSISALGLCDLYWTYRYDAAYAFKPCTLEIKRNGRFKGVYVECCSSTTKNISPIPHSRDGDLPERASTHKTT